jgi:hypothetical protein
MTMARSLLACALILPMLAACASSERTDDNVLGARGPIVDHVRGAAPPGAENALRPEPGNIWSEGLTPSQPASRR